jgi:energy-coupling factor transporter transmembrane protein EcfT
MDDDDDGAASFSWRCRALICLLVLGFSGQLWFCFGAAKKTAAGSSGNFWVVNAITVFVFAMQLTILYFAQQWCAGKDIGGWTGVIVSTSCIVFSCLLTYFVVSRTDVVELTDGNEDDE